MQENTFYLISRSGCFIKKMDRKSLSKKSDHSLPKEIPKFAIDRECALNELIEETIQDIDREYEKKSYKISLLLREYVELPEM